MCFIYYICLYLLTPTLWCILMSQTNTIVPLVCEFICELESHTTEHSKQLSLLVKINLFRWFNSAIALAVISLFIETISVAQVSSAFEKQSLIYEVYPVILAELFISPVIEAADLPGNFRRHFLAPRAKDQSEMNACFTGTRFWLAERYTNANRVLFVALFFSSILPESLFLGSLALLAQYHVGKYALLRLCSAAPDVGFYLARFNRGFFYPVTLITHMIMSAYWWSGYPYDQVCQNNYDGGYMYCNQDFWKSRVFPPLPRFQPNNWRWMTEEQQTVTSLYGWTSLVAVLLAFLHFVKNNVLPWILSIYESTYEPDGKDQMIPFSEARNCLGYVPQIQMRGSGFLFPLLACDIEGIDENLIGWRDSQSGYEPHNLSRDVEAIIKSRKLRRPIFSIVRQWKKQHGSNQHRRSLD